MNILEVLNKQTIALIELMKTNFKLKADKTELNSHIGNKSNPHGVGLTQLGVNASATELNHVKGVTSGIQGQLDGKSDSDHTHTVDSSLSSTSTNPVQNKVVKTELDKKATTSALDSHTSDTVKHITSTERTTWNNKSDFSGNYNDLEDAPNIVEDGTGTLKIMDQNDNIIMEIGKDGLNVATLTVNGTGDVATVLTQYEEAIDTNKTNIDKKADKTDLTSHTGNKNNPHGVTLSQLGITATAAELNKLDGVTATTAELNYVDGVTSNIQTQLNAKQATITGAATTITGSDLTKSRALISNSNGKVAVSAVTSTELGYLDGVTSNVQAQLDSKEPEITVLPVAKGGTGNSSVDTTPTSGSTKMVTSGGVYTAIDTVNTELDTKMDKANPTGTGAFSLNRKAGSGVGSYSSTLGSENTASGIYSHAEGHNNTAQGEASHTEGFNTVANEKYAHAEGKNAIAQGQSSHAEGTSSIAFAESAHAEGYSSYATGKYSHAEGHCAWTYGDASHAEGQYTMAYGDYSHAEGEGDIAEIKITGDANATIYTTDATSMLVIKYYGLGAVVQYNDVYAIITNIDVDNYQITTDVTLSSSAISSQAATMHVGVASGKASHSEGYWCNAGGYASHAEGEETSAIGNASHSDGIGTIALTNQFAIGHYNNITTATEGTQSGTSTGTAFVIGNGGANKRSNAFRVTYDGTPYAKNALTTTGCDYAEFFEWFDGNPNSEDRRGYFVTLDGEKITKAKQGDYILGITSALPSIIGNGDEDWKGRYILDEFGAFIKEEFEYEVVVDRKVVIDEETGERTVEEIKEKKIGVQYKENPDYDPTAPYVQRSERPEWSTVGMLGVIAVRDDGSCKVNGFCTVSDDGTAIASDNGYRVVARVTDNIVKVIFR